MCVFAAMQFGLAGALPGGGNAAALAGLRLAGHAHMGSVLLVSNLEEEVR